MKTPADEVRAARQVLCDKIVEDMERFEEVSGSRVESINVSWKTEKSGGGGLDPDKEVRTVEVNIII